MTRRSALALGTGAVALAVGVLIVWITLLRPATFDAQPDMAAHEVAATSGSPDPGTARGDVTIDTRRQQLIGVRTAPVRRVTLQPQIRTTGTVAFDETRQADVNIKIDGWIRDLYVDYTGRPVREGEPLLTLYSPDLLATQDELLLALRGRQQSRGSGSGDMRTYSERLVEAARQRLLLWDVSAQEIEELEASGRATGVVTVRAPASGFVADKTAVRGMRVMAGQSLYRIADTTVVWVEANVYAQDLPLVRVGQSATVTAEGARASPLLGRAIYVHPTVNEQTRTGMVRFQFANRDGRLKPGMYVDIDLHAAAASVLAVPADAVLDSGSEQIVFVAEGEGRFTPRRVTTGRRADADVEIVEGLTEDEVVATSAAFFLDSESQLRAGIQSYEPSPPAIGGPGGAGAQVEMTFRSRPDPPRAGDSTFEVTVKDASGQPLRDAEVGVVLFMPAMPSMNMPAMRSETTLTPAGDGVYRGSAQVITTGRWDVTVTVRQGGRTVGSRQFALVAR